LIGGIGNYGKCILSGLRTHLIGFETLLSGESDILESIVVYNCEDLDSFAAGHIAGVLAYYYPEVSVYRKGFRNTEASPYANLYELEDFSAKDNESFLLLTEPCQQITEKLEADYVCQYIGRADRYECVADVYLLNLQLQHTARACYSLMKN